MCLLYIINYQMLQKILKIIKRGVIACDLFSTTELLRYKQNPEFKSANGGLCSIAVLIFFTVIFTQTILNTFAKSKISSKITLYEQVQPSHYSTEDSPFRFAIGVNGYNLNHNTTKYFNIQISQKSIIKGVKKTVYYPLVPCNRTEWVQFDPSLGSTFDSIGLSSYLCLQNNVSFSFTGKFTSNIFEYVKIGVKDCKLLPGDTRTCVNSSKIDANIASGGPISLNYYFVNTIINAGNEDYLGSYLQDRNYFPFTRTMGTSANIFISSYSIQTDQSLWPWQQIKEETGGIVYQPTVRFVYTPSIDPGATEYIALFLRKSSLSLSIARSFKKYDDTLSYIGGLFSTFMVCLFFMKKYNEYSYEIEIASKIYKYKQNKNIYNHKFNLISCAGYCIYSILNLFKIQPNWKTMKHFDAVREEISKQLDLKLMVRKITFLQDCIHYLFEDYQLQCLHLKGKMTLNQAESIRKRFSSRKQLLKLKKKYQAEASKSEIQSIQNNKQQLNMSQQQVYDFSRAQTNVLSVLNQEKNNSNEIITQRTSPLEENVNSSDSELEEEKDEQETLTQYISSINQLKTRALNGNSRCKRIYDNLDRFIKAIPSSVKFKDNQKCKKAMAHTQQKIDKEPDRDFIFLKNVQFHND